MQWDAFRHTYMAIRLTQVYGPDLAKEILDAHEISDVNRPTERRTDLHTNAVGIRLATDPANRGRPASEVALEAFRRGELQTAPDPKMRPGGRDR